MGKADYKKMENMDENFISSCGCRNRCFKIKRDVSKKRRRIDKKELLSILNELECNYDQL